MSTPSIIPDAANILGGGQPDVRIPLAPPQQQSQPQTQVAPTQAPAQSPPQTPTQTTAQAPSQDQPDNRSVAHKVIGAIADVLGGKSVDRPYYDDNGNLQHQKTPLSRGQQVGNIVGGALRGMAAGAQVHGAGAGMRSFATGAGAEMQHQQQQQELARQHAGEDFNARQTALNNQAHRTYLAQEKAAKTWEMRASQIKLAAETRANEQQLQKLVAGDPNSEDLGMSPTWTDFLKNHPDVQQAAKDHAQGVLMPVTVTDEDGNVAGVHVFKVTPQFFDQKTEQDTVLQIPSGLVTDQKTGKPVLDKDGLPQTKYTQQVVKAGSATNGEIVQFQNARSVQEFNQLLERRKTQVEQQNANTNLLRARAEASEASARVQALSLEVGEKKQQQQTTNDWAAALQDAGGDRDKAVGVLKAKYPKSFGLLSAAESLDFAKNGEMVTEDQNGEKVTVKRQHLFTEGQPQSGSMVSVRLANGTSGQVPAANLAAFMKANPGAQRADHQ